MPASQKVRTISRRYRDGWALRCRCAHVVPPRGAALAAVGRRGPGGTGRARLRRVGVPRAEKDQTQEKKGDLISPGGISSQSTKCRSPFACSRSAFPRSEIKFEARRPECARFCQANWPRQARDGAGPRSARTDSPMPAALSFFRCTALRAPCFHFFGTRRACLFFVV